MTQLQSKWVKRQITTPLGSESGDVVSELFEYSLAAALVVGDIIELAVLPTYATVVDAVLIADDLDTNGTPTITLDVGIMSGEVGVLDAARTCGAEIFSGSTVAQAGGVARPSLATAFRIAALEGHRSIGVKVAAGPATGATTGKIQLRLFYAQ
jgi:hypothetical protein